MVAEINRFALSAFVLSFFALVLCGLWPSYVMAADGMVRLAQGEAGAVRDGDVDKVERKRRRQKRKARKEREKAEAEARKKAEAEQERVNAEQEASRKKAGQERRKAAQKAARKKAQQERRKAAQEAARKKAQQERRKAAQKAARNKAQQERRRTEGLQGRARLAREQLEEKLERERRAAKPVKRPAGTTRFVPRNGVADRRYVTDPIESFIGTRRTREPSARKISPTQRSAAPRLAQAETERAERLRRIRRRLNRKRRRRELRQQQKLSTIRSRRRQRRDGKRLVIEEPDGRRIVRRGDRTIIRGNDTGRLRLRSRDVAVRSRNGRQITTVTRPNGSQIVTVRDRRGRLLRRVRRGQGGRERVIINNRLRNHRRYHRDDDSFFLKLALPVIGIAAAAYIVDAAYASRHDIYDTFAAPPVRRLPRRYSLDEIRYNYPLRAHMRSVNLTMVNFDSGSWYIDQRGYDRLEDVAHAMRRVIRRNPEEVFLVEGHTDAVGSVHDNLSLSDRRAESVATALSEDFNIPAENLVTQGYGEAHLLIRTRSSSRRNRRVVLRRITPLLSQDDYSDY